MDRCQCVSAGYCNRFEREMNQQDIESCQDGGIAFTHKISVWRTQQLLAKGITEQACYWKGELLRDEHGFVKKRQNTGCCGQGPETVERFECFHPRIAEGESFCEGRCYFVKPLNSEHRSLLAPETQADSVSLTITELAAPESLATEGD